MRRCFPRDARSTILRRRCRRFDKGFQRRIARIYNDWRQSIATALENGIEHGTVRKHVSPSAVAALLVAVFAGTEGTVKSAQSPELFRQIREALFEYLDSLKP
jgi:Tetracyclin repressor-like, C-terminal domain